MSYGKAQKKPVETEANNTLLSTIYKEGVFFNETTFEEIRERIDQLV